MEKDNTEPTKLKQDLPPNIPTVDADKAKQELETLIRAACMMIADNGGVQKFEVVMTNKNGEPRPIAIIVLPDVKRAQEWIQDPNKKPVSVTRTKIIGV